MTVTENPALFQKIQVGKMLLEHKVAMAPLTRRRADTNHVPTDIMAEYYGQRASRPGTLLVTEATFIAKKAGGSFHVPGIYSGAQVAGWKKVFDQVHANKSFAFVQLWALGRSAAVDQLEGEDYVSASDVPVADGPAPRPLTVDEIKSYVQSYVEAAKNAVAAGADGVEIHSANGYLLDQFLHANTNKRTDQYGGSIENRARFTLEVVDAISAAIGSERVAIRLSPWGTFGEVDPGVSPIPQYSYVVEELERRALQGKRLAYVSVVEPRVTGNVDVEEWTGSNEFVSQIWTGPLMKAGAMHKKEARDEAFTDDRTILAIGRSFISNPDIVNRLEQGIELTPYDRSTFYTQDAVGYTDYKFATN
ncbi:NADPH dehydrogenase 3 [Trichomonascus vanleenenianus]|uniref:alkene reductase n=1 Tax=Trichomonascus vanleenenianus TaxID=2268995 RepID=UPI003EC9CF81